VRKEILRVGQWPTDHTQSGEVLIDPWPQPAASARRNQ
jgi:hypothetical protein